MDKFTQGYITAALCTEFDESDRPLDETYTAADIAPCAMERITADCQVFQTAHADDLASCDLEKAGIDFWLTRNGHGAGFWDGDYPDDIGRRLTAGCEAVSMVWLYVGDDGRLYTS